MFLFATSLTSDAISYNHLLSGDTRYSTHLVCEVHDDGYLTTADPGYQGKTISCVCGNLYGCTSLMAAENSYTWAFAKDSLFGANAAIFLTAYITQRKYLVALGTHDNRPRTISAASILTLGVTFLSLNGPSIGVGWLTAQAQQLGVLDIVSAFTTHIFNLVISILTLAIGTALMISGKRSRAVWIASIVSLSITLVVLSLNIDYYSITRPIEHLELNLLVAFSCVALYLLLRNETRRFYAHYSKSVTSSLSA